MWGRHRAGTARGHACSIDAMRRKCVTGCARALPVTPERYAGRWRNFIPVAGPEPGGVSHRQPHRCCASQFGSRSSAIPAGIRSTQIHARSLTIPRAARSPSRKSGISAPGARRRTELPPSGPVSTRPSRTCASGSVGEGWRSADAEQATRILRVLVRVTIRKLRAACRQRLPSEGSSVLLQSSWPLSPINVAMSHPVRLPGVPAWQVPSHCAPRRQDDDELPLPPAVLRLPELPGLGAATAGEAT